MDRNTCIDDLELSSRSRNALRRNKVNIVGELILQDESTLRSMSTMGEKSITEVLAKIEECKSALSVIDGVQNSVVETWICSSEKSAIVMAYLKDNNTSINVLTELTPAEYNLLNLYGYTTLYGLASEKHEVLLELQRLSKAQLEHIMMLCTKYIDANWVAISRDYSSLSVNNRTDSFESIIANPDNIEKILSVVRTNDVAVEYMGFEKKALEILVPLGYRFCSDLLFRSKENFKLAAVTKAATIDGILIRMRAIEDQYLSVFTDIVNDKDVSYLLNEERIHKLIFEMYRDQPFAGLSFNDYKERFAKIGGIEDARLKQVIGGLISEKKLVYVDYRCYKVYPSFFDVFNICESLDDRERKIIEERFINGLSLEQVGKELGVTRERIRQIAVRAYDKILKENRKIYGECIFDEDYYLYLFENYSFNKEIAEEWLGISKSIFKYLVGRVQDRKMTDIEEAIDDLQIALPLRLKVKNFINRKSIYIDGEWISNKRNEIENYVLRKFCTKVVNYDEFIERYNSFLEEEEIPFDEDLYITEKVRRTRENRLTDSKLLLWQQNKKFRYYDINARDYSEFFEELNLESYNDISISTQKLINDHPDLMKKYDIQTKDELHNLLKKLEPTESNRGYTCKGVRMPHIKFGSPDMDKWITDLLMTVAPISQDDLCDIIYKELGFHQASVKANYLGCINEYYNKGMYMIPEKKMSDSDIERMKEVLDEDFYFYDDLRRIYKSIKPNADVNEINTYSVVKMGFVVRNSYAIRNFDSSRAYFTHLLTSSDSLDISGFNGRFGYLMSYYDTQRRLKNGLSIVEYAPNKIFSIGKLENGGITKDMIYDFRDKVFDFVEEGKHFTIKSIASQGFESELFDYGFDDWFYANLIATDERFVSVKMMGTIFLAKGVEYISKMTLCLELVREAGVIDIMDLMSDLANRFGCDNISKSSLIENVSNTQVFYDTRLERFYVNRNAYYEELERYGG